MRKEHPMAKHFIAFWNLENLFAPQDFEDRPEWLAKRIAADLKGWTAELLDQKITQLASIISQMNTGKGPDVLGVCEVENRFVLDALAGKLNEKLVGREYIPVHADSNEDQRGIDTAFLYDKQEYGHDPATLFNYFVIRRTGTRDITQATFTTKSGQPLVLLCNHWPSRSGGSYESQGYRATAGETLSYFHSRIREELGENIPILAMGDFNDDPFNDSLVLHAEATRERGDVERTETVPRFYNLAWRYLQQEGIDRKGNRKLLNGTLYFKGNGNVFDQLLASKGLLISSSPLRVKEETARIELFPEMVDDRSSEGPIRFGLPKGDVQKNVNTKGYSDHFPVSVELEEDQV
jgi:endonuclease/exonuclease/phosphatase family metal-dependent hydrolase